MKLELALLDDEGKLLSAVNVEGDSGLLTLPMDQLMANIIQPALVVLRKGVKKPVTVSQAVRKALNGHGRTLS